MTTIKEVRLELHKEYEKRKPNKKRIQDLENFITYLVNRKVAGGLTGLIIALLGLGIMFLIPYWYGLLMGVIPTMIGAAIFFRELFE